MDDERGRPPQARRTAGPDSGSGSGHRGASAKADAGDANRDDRPGDEAQRNEFGVVAGWSAAILATADRTSAMAGACRGSGSPAALAWLAESLRLEPGMRLLDVGAGLGGPAAWASDRFGVSATAVEPMARACRGSARLFGSTNVVARADALPLAAGAFDAAWTLGVLDTVDDLASTLGQVNRVLRASGRFAVLAYVADGPIPAELVPEGNRFETAAALEQNLVAAGFDVRDRAAGNALPEAPRAWQDAQDDLDRALERRHGDDPRWQEAKRQERRFSLLLEQGLVQSVLLCATRR